MSRALDWRELQLSGRVLIEASAGTGKTYTIALIYLRLLLESAADVRSILVCTFTDAAAQELRERIRARLFAVERWLDDAETDLDDELQAWLRARCDADADAVRQRLRLARLELDRAPIGTIHGFLARVLRDYPFLCGTALRGAAMLDEAALLGECFEDFLRRALQSDPAARPPYAMLLAREADRLRGDVAQLLNNPDAVLLGAPIDAAATLAASEAELQRRETLDQLRVLREGRADGVRWNARAAFPQELEVALDLLAAGGSLLELESATLEALSTDSALKGVARDCRDAATAHPALCRLLAAADQARTLRPALRAQALIDAHAYCRSEIARRCSERGALSFSQLVERVAAALQGEHGARLAATLAQAYPHVLIDEFQDTDQRQFGIFERIHAAGAGTSAAPVEAPPVGAGSAANAVPESFAAEAAPTGTAATAAAPGPRSLHLIGDPKQAIYGFRGGDLEAYLRAARATGAACYTLATNYRSAPPMVEAINRLYGASGDGFAHPQIVYRPVDSAGPSDGSRYDSADTARLHIHCDARDGNKEQLRADALAACAAAIAELLDDPGRRIDGQPISPGQLAVLLPDNAAIGALRAQLAVRGVPCVGAGRASVLASPVAEELELVLHAALHPGDPAALRAALGCSLLGAELARLQRMDADPALAEAEAVRFERWGRLWRERGPLALVEALGRERAAVELGHGDGERRLTDLRHLGELLQDEQPAHAGPPALFEAFRRQRREACADDALAPPEERLLRLESDAARVRLMTLHGCKGLQFPIVFLPLAFEARSRPPRLARFHDDAGRLCFDLGSADAPANAERAALEERQERLRLLYVALTRAVHACHVFCREAGQGSALDGLFDAITARAAAASRRAALAALAADGGVIALHPAWPVSPARYRAAPADARPRRAREDLPAARPPLWLVSFSALARQAAEAERGQAADEQDAGVDPLGSGDDAPAPALLALASWRGLGFGNALHAVLERSDPALPLWPAQAAMLARELAAAGVGGGELPLEALGRRLDALRQAGLGGGLRLAALAPEQRVAEFTFHFPLQDASLARLRAVCAAHGQPDLIPPGLAPARLDGMMGGAIDLLLQHDGRFHVLDYKGNWLGDRLADYSGPALDAIMASAHYRLQALIYGVAAHRYLRRRLPGYRADSHLGDAIYLFVRAVGLAPGAGLWRRRYDPALIDAVDRVLDGEAVPA